MPLPDLSALPIWGQVLVYAILGLSIGVAIVLTRFGYLSGKRTPIDKNPAAATVAAVIVDPTALNKLNATIGKLNATVSQLADLVGQYVADEREEREEREIEGEVQRRVDVQLREQRSRQRRARKPSN